jgi:voltage-gated potassium channel
LYRSKNKRAFFKSNIFDLLAIIPFDSFFRAFRLVRLARVIKMAVFAKRFTSRATPFLKTNGFIYILFLTIFLMAVGSIIAFYFEKGASMESYSDAIWWSFVTTTTVGYREVAPETMGGRVTAAFLMLAGIGFIGMLTGTITTYFIKKTKPTLKRDDQILDLTDVDKETFEKIKEYSEYVKSK